MTFEQLVTQSLQWQHPTVALFYGNACRPCELLKPRLRAVCENLSVRLETFNTAGEMEQARALGLRSVPAVFSVHKGIVKPIFGGLLTNQEIADKLRLAGVIQ